MVNTVSVNIPSPSLIYGCMGLGGGWNKSSEASSSAHIKEAETIIFTCLDNGINFFDHADIYALGRAESVFGSVLQNNPALRQKIILQSKIGIQLPDNETPKQYNFSFNYIINAAKASLARLKTEYLDILLLHRPDPLMEVNEVARAFNFLKHEGLVKHFGVSNQSLFTIKYLQKYLDIPLVANQLQMSLIHSQFVESTISFNDYNNPVYSNWQGLIEYCQENKIQLQAWGPLDKGLLLKDETNINLSDNLTNTKKLVVDLSQKYQCSKEAILLSWLMKYPAAIIPIIGTTNINRIKSCVQANKDLLNRNDWYSLLESARGKAIP